MDEFVQVDELHLWLVVSFVAMGWNPYLVSQILWLLIAVGLYMTTPDYAVVQEGIGGG